MSGKQKGERVRLGDERNFEHKKNPDDSDECRGLKGLNVFSFSLRVVVLTLLEYVSSKFL